MTDYSAVIRDHLTKQKAKAMDKGQCSYRSPEGNKCAVGCLIPDELYDVSFEGFNVWSAFDAASLAPAADVSKDRSNTALALRHALPADLDRDTADAWQDYHDNSRGVARRHFCYQLWIDGEEAHSPTAFYDALRVAMADKAEVYNG